MINYDEMSDFDINIRVGNILHERCEKGSDNQACIPDILGNHGLCVGWRVFDPCNSWVDAGIVIHSNDISLISRRANGEWKAELFLCRKDSFDTYATCFHKNPLRAAMIVFLMKQEEYKCQSS